MCRAPLPLTELSTPKLTSSERSALPVIWLIWLFRKALSAEFMENELVLPSARYMPVVSMATACLARSSLDMLCSWLCSVMSSGASMMNSRPMLESIWLTTTPQVNTATRPPDASPPTVALVCSVAVRWRAGSMGSPRNSM